MKRKSLILLIVLMSMLVPFTANAMTSEDEYGPAKLDVIENTKYYKTIIVLNNQEMLSNVEGQNLSITTEITEEEFNNTNIASPYESTTNNASTKKLTIRLEKYNSYYKYTAIAEWKLFPSLRTYNTLGIGHYSSVKNQATPDFEQYYCISGSGCHTQTAGYYIKKTNNGSAATFYLPSGTLTALKQTFTSIVTKTDSTSKVIEQKAVASYGEATSDISYNDAKDYLINTSGLQYNNNKNIVMNANVYWNGSW